MNKFFITILCGLAFISCKQTFEPIKFSKDQVSQESKMIAANAAKTYFEGCYTSQSREELKQWLSDERYVTPRLRKAISDAKADCVCEKLNSSFGKMQGLELDEIFGNGSSVVMFKYKATYDLLEKPAQIAVYLDFQNKLSGITIREGYAEGFGKFEASTSCQNL